MLAGDGEYKIGVWLREDTEGIGTLTYVTEDNNYVALGHGITDIDTGILIDIQIMVYRGNYLTIILINLQQITACQTVAMVITAVKQCRLP